MGLVSDSATHSTLTVTETLRALSVSTRDYVYRLIESGRLTGEKVDGAWRIDRSSVEAYLERRAEREARRAKVAPSRASVDDLFDQVKELT